MARSGPQACTLPSSESYAPGTASSASTPRSQRTQGPDRATACARLAAALDDLVLTGVPTTAPYLRAVLDRPDHAAMEHDTGSVERDWAPGPAARPEPTREPATARAVHLATDRGALTLRVPRHRAGATGAAAAVALRPERSGPVAGSTPAGDPVAPMDATVVEVVVAPGDDVDAGAVLVVLEAMKMELPVRASRATRVDVVHVAPGDRVTAGSALVAVTPAVPEP